MVILMGFGCIGMVKADKDDHIVESYNTAWYMQSDENKLELLKPVIALGVEATCAVAKWGWNKLFGDSEEDLEKKALEGLKCGYIYYYNNYNNSGKPAINIKFTPSEDNTNFYTNLYGEHFSFKGYYELNKKHTGIICELDKKITSFPEKIKIEVVGPKSKQTKVWTGTISKASD